VGIILLLLSIFANEAECAKATHYAGDLTGLPMAWKELPYDPLAYSCASWDYPLGTILCVQSVKWGKGVIVTVTDRHDFKTDIDLSFIAFTELAPYWYDQGVEEVIITEIKH